MSYAPAYLSKPEEGEIVEAVGVVGSTGHPLPPLRVGGLAPRRGQNRGPYEPSTSRSKESPRNRPNSKRPARPPFGGGRGGSGGHSGGGQYGPADNGTGGRGQYGPAGDGRRGAGGGGRYFPADNGAGGRKGRGRGRNGRGRRGRGGKDRGRRGDGAGGGGHCGPGAYGGGGRSFSPGGGGIGGGGGSLRGFMPPGFGNDGGGNHGGPASAIMPRRGQNQEYCRDYLHTGRCKYGESCRYFHPQGGNDGRETAPPAQTAHAPPTLGSHWAGPLAGRPPRPPTNAQPANSVVGSDTDRPPLVCATCIIRINRFSVALLLCSHQSSHH